jgi:lipopolysaccharide heptosyltransferase II
MFSTGLKKTVTEINKNKIHNILAIRTDRMGDFLPNIAAIRALKESFNSNICALVNPSVKELLLGMPEIDEVLAFDEAKWDKSIFAKLDFIRRLRRMKFDLVVVLNPTKRFHLITYLAGIPLRLGYDRKWGCLLTHKIKDQKFLGQKHEVEYNLDLVRTIGAETKDKQISIKIEPGDLRFIENLFARYAVKDADLVIAIHPHSSNPAKCWPRQYFASLADKLKERFSAKIIIIGGKAERAASFKLISLSQYPIINLCGRLSLKQLAALFQRCALLISNDSGPVHIAAAVGTKTVVIFGRNIPGVGPRRWGPWGEGHAVLHKDPGCEPCLDERCQYNFQCLTAITQEDVIAAVETQLKR